MEVGGILDKLTECLVTDSSLCSRVRHKLSDCNLCMEVCGHDAVMVTKAGGKVIIDGDKCSGCGKCAAVCPNKVFSLKSAERMTLMTELDKMIRRDKALKLACSKCGENDAVNIRSLAYADRYLLVRALRLGAESITMIKDDCSKCRMDCIGISEREAEVCRHIIDEAGLDVPIAYEVYVKPDKRTGKGGAYARLHKSEEMLSRREFFGFLKTKAKKKVGETLSSLNESDKDSKRTVLTSDNGSPERNLSSDLRSIGGEELLGKLRTGGVLHSITIDQEACALCGVCARVCPFGVLSPVTERVKGHDRIIDISIDLSACTGCGICALTCMTRAVRIL